MQVQRTARSIPVLKPEGLLSPAPSLLPAWGQLLSQEGVACRTHPARAHGKQREPYFFVRCLVFANNPFHAFHRGYITNTGAWRTLTWSCLVCSNYQGDISSRGYENSFPVNSLAADTVFPSPVTARYLGVNVCSTMWEVKIAVCQRVCWKGLLLCS